MLLRVLVVGCLVTAVVGFNVNEDRVEDLRKRISDIKNNISPVDGGETRSEDLKEIVAQIPMKGTRQGSGIEDDFLCGICMSIIGNFLNLRRVQMQSEAALKRLAIEMCVDFEIQSEEVCSGLVEFNTPSILYIVDNRANLTADTICKLLLNDGHCMNPFDDSDLEFTVNIDEGKSIENSPIPMPDSPEALTIVQLTDIHFDPKYKQGAFADCEESACCRETDDVNEDDPSSLAGYWGDYRACDSPWHAIDDAFHHNKQQHSKIDAVYFTGDVVDHFMWDASVEGMRNEIEKVYNHMSSVLSGIPMYPILGNHEAQNIFAPTDVREPTLSVQWLYEHVAQLWQGMLPAEALETVKLGGYYTTLVRPGLRLIALNNNVCFTFNWWIVYSVKSIQAQFQWLHDVLLAAEKAGEKVHILAHIPNGNEDYHLPCSREFRRIVDRFHRIIVAQFNGHTEHFGFNIFHEGSNETRPVNIAWNGGSLATYSGVNRNYVVYGVDPVTYQVADLESWIYNLTEANQHGLQSPKWYRQFSLRDAFNLKDLSPATISNFIWSLPRNRTAIQQLWRMRIRDSDWMLKRGCSKSCHRDVLCDVLIAENSDKALCQKMKKDLETR